MFYLLEAICYIRNYATPQATFHIMPHREEVLLTCPFKTIEWLKTETIIDIEEHACDYFSICLIREGQTQF